MDSVGELQRNEAHNRERNGTVNDQSWEDRAKKNEQESSSNMQL